MVDIFISYAHKDKDKVKILAHLFRAQGWSVWWDKHIPAGKRFDIEIRKILDSASCIVVFWSSASINSEFVLDEAEVGRIRNVLIAVQLEKVDLPLGFGRRLAIDISGWDSRNSSHPQFNKLLESLETILGPSPVRRRIIVASGSKNESNPKRGKKFYVTTSIITATVCISLAIVTLTKNDHEHKLQPILVHQDANMQSGEFDTHPKANLYLIKNNQISGPFQTPYVFKAPFGESIEWRIDREGYITRTGSLVVGVSGQNSYIFNLERVE